ncbi:MAG: hypothetical protein AAFR35_14310 [Pseudomonadota bacterium]
MSEPDLVTISRTKIELLERHAKWFIEEYKAGRIVHFSDDSELEMHGLMRVGPYNALRAEMIRLTENVSDDDMAFLEALMTNAAPSPDGGPIRLDSPLPSDESRPVPAFATERAADLAPSEEEQMMEDALSELYSLEKSGEGAA